MNVNPVTTIPFRPKAMKQEWNDFAIASLKPCPVVMFARLNLKNERCFFTPYYRRMRDGSLVLWHSKTSAKLNDDIIRQANRDFEKSLNMIFFRRAFIRFPEKRIKFFSWLHNEPQKHLHLLFEAPEGNDRATPDKIDWCVKNAFTKNLWFGIDSYCEPVDSIEAAVWYSSRGTAKSII